MFIVRTWDNLDRRLTEKGLAADGLTPGWQAESWRMRDASFSYQLSGRMLTAATDQVVKAWAYDDAGRPQSHTASRLGTGATSWTFTYGWDVAGNLTQLVYPTTSVLHPGGLTATYAYDALGRMTGVTTTGVQAASASIAYDTLSRRTGVTFGDGSAQAYAYEADDDLSSMGHTFPTSSHNVTLTWSNDKLGRQVSETTSNSAYLYDPPVDNTAYTAAGSLNQNAPTTAAYTWSSHGALSSDGVRGFFYDEKRNLTLSRQGLASANNFDQDFFDALGVRWWSYRSAPSASDPHRIELTDGLRPEVAWEALSNTAEGSTTPVPAGSRYYVLGPNPDERLIWIDASAATLKARYPHSNRRGDTIAISKDGAAETKFKYGPYGESSDSTAGYPWRFTGQRLNSWTGLYHFKARAYSPTVGRFTQPDPIGYEDGPNLYAYVGNDPFNAKDPTGTIRDGDPRTDFTLALAGNSPREIEIYKQGEVIAGRRVGAALSEAPWIVLALMDGPQPGPADAAALSARQVVKGGVESVITGAKGEAAVRRIATIGEKQTIFINGRFRIPDSINGNVLSEVKNVGKQHFSTQLKDYLAYAKSKNLRFDLWVRADTKLTRPLIEAYKRGDINIRIIPK